MEISLDNIGCFILLSYRYFGVLIQEVLKLRIFCNKCRKVVLGLHQPIFLDFFSKHDLMISKYDLLGDFPRSFDDGRRL